MDKIEERKEKRNTDTYTTHVNKKERKNNNKKWSLLW